jgi:cyclic-di-GMP-binding protein
VGDANSFDVVSDIDLQEVDNAVNQSMKEIVQRYDFKGSVSRITLDKTKKEIELYSDDEGKLRSVVDILQSKFIKRGLPLKALDLQTAETVAGGKARQMAKLVCGIPMEICKDIVRLIKDSKMKVQASIHEDKVKVSGKSRDELQAVIQMLKGREFKVALQFTNYR